ncbi:MULTISPECIES: CinA family protein [unclassified Paludibacterium]|uniref:CinA family protein n=1 Tax=unclassified Paludibacterium TaxID=2618429 RepID=UPI001C04105A|nr:CinA family protein [Paludibacterium sp. B53371]BEV71279.1 nicotinamide-nucleotide amidase [Paludibacterium sp. THUN1379]
MQHGAADWFEQAAALAQRLGLQLQARAQCVATAESCTGGLISGALTAVPGSSAWFGFGFVTYSNEAKQQLLGVDGDTLRCHGAVSEATVRQMARGACRAAKADWAVAVSGVAGPGGGSADKPVGTVWFGLAGPDGDEAFVCHFDGDRDEVRGQTVLMALQRLLARCAAATSVV